MIGQGETLVIGVDGGGTSCRFAVANAGGRVTAQVHLGPANIASDFDAA
jgi:glucosamine kinase